MLFSMKIKAGTYYTGGPALKKMTTFQFSLHDSETKIRPIQDLLPQD
jgi:hypothetical protein